MKKILAGMMTAAMLVAMAFAFTGCGAQPTESSSADGSNAASVSAVCSNGIMIGQEEDGIVSYLGVPYAEQPVGDLRWKAPVAPADSDEEIVCDQFGHTSLQYEWPTEPASSTAKGEDCLSLNIWTGSESSDTPKNVMVFIHGGAFSWGGTNDEMYYGYNFAKAHPDTILVTCNYRLGLMGFADFSQVPGGEEYTDINLGIRDQIAALEWVKNNIDAFGGDPDSVTVFGESAGGFSIGALLYSPMTEGLFKNAILESGVLTPHDRADAQEFADYIMEASGSETMDDLLAIDGDEWMEIDGEEWIGDEVAGIVYDGEVVPFEEDMDAALQRKVDQGVNILLGTNAAEWNYFLEDAEGETDDEKFESWTEALNENWAEYYDNTDEEGRTFMDQFYETEAANVSADYASDEALKDALVKSAFITESWRMDHVRFADKYADMGGNVYMYIWNVPSTKDDYFKSACHAVELAYVFNNLDDGIYAGEVDPAIADQTQQVWLSFAKTGDPSVGDVSWTKYDTKDRGTMMITKDGWNMESDPTAAYREGLDHIGAELIW